MHVLHGWILQLDGSLDAMTVLPLPYIKAIAGADVSRSASQQATSPLMEAVSEAATRLSSFILAAHIPAEVNLTVKPCRGRRMFACTHTHAHARVRLCGCGHVCACMHACVCVCMRACMCVCLRSGPRGPPEIGHSQHHHLTVTERQKSDTHHTDTINSSN